MPGPVERPVPPTPEKVPPLSELPPLDFVPVLERPEPERPVRPSTIRPEELKPVLPTGLRKWAAKHERSVRPALPPPINAVSIEEFHQLPEAEE